VLREEQAMASLDAGASFIMSPIFTPELIPICHERGAYCVVGAVTPTEIYMASQAGSDGVLIFPAVDTGGVNYLRRVHEQMPGVSLMAHGGLSVDDVQAYWDAGVSLVALGSVLLPDEMVEHGEWTQVADNLHKVVGSMPQKW
jgi:2-dehydro-3-deoxyphosphogluconate aldolase/(4S)-4-hydroxy-2-oxoglutarate aldolase